MADKKRLPELKSKPIIGVPEDEWKLWTMKRIVLRENLKQATKKRATNPNYLKTRGKQYASNSNKIRIYKVISGEGRWNGRQKVPELYRPGIDEPKGTKSFIYSKIIEKEYITTCNSQNDCARFLAPDAKKAASYITRVSQCLKNEKKLAFMDYTFEYEEATGPKK